MLKPLPIKPSLDEDTRLGDIILGGVVVAMHRAPDNENVYYITEHSDYESVYMMVDVALWNKIFE